MAERKYFAIVTDKGNAQIAQAIANGQKLNITTFVAGDANGEYYIPTSNMTAIKNEVWRGTISKADVVQDAQKILRVTTVIPAEVSGFVVRELGLLDDTGELIAIGNSVDLPKVSLQDGFSVELELSMRIAVKNTEVFSFTIDPHMVIMTKDMLDTHNVDSNAHEELFEGKVNKTDLEIELNNKYDKTGGTISGNVTINGSVAEGNNLTANVGDTISAHAEGEYTTTFGRYIHAEGGGCVASADGSHAEGAQTIAGGLVLKVKSVDVENKKMVFDDTIEKFATIFNTIAVNTKLHVINLYYSNDATRFTVTNIDTENKSVTVEENIPASNFTPSYAVVLASYNSVRCVHTEGYRTIASSEAAHAEGNGTIASGQSSHAEGIRTMSKNSYSHAEGYETIANGYSSHAEGYKTRADSWGSHTEGGWNMSCGDYSHAEGAGTLAVSYDSHAEGGITIATGYHSHAEGFNTVAMGYYSHAEGLNTIAGYNTNILLKIKSVDYENRMITFDTTYQYHNTTFSKLKVNRSINITVEDGYMYKVFCLTIESINTSNNSIKVKEEIIIANKHFVTWHYAYYGEYVNYTKYYASHAEGEATQARGTCSHAGCYNTIANDFQTAIGKYNTNYSGGTETGTSGSAFVIGNGTSSSAKSNCFRVQYNGATYAKGNYNSSGADYAELFKWLDDNKNKEDRTGLFVTVDGEEIRIATPDDDYIVGIISACPSVIGDVHDDTWRLMYLTDIFGRILYEEIDVPDEVIEIPDPENPEQTITQVVREAHKEKVPKLNPEYDNTQKYIPRSERPEWAAVGMLGKLVAIDDGSCEKNGWCTVGNGGVATKSEKRTKFRVMSRLDENHIKVLIL